MMVTVSTAWATFMTMEPRETGMAILISRIASTRPRMGRGEYFRSEEVMPSPRRLWRISRNRVPTRVLRVTPRMAAADTACGIVGTMTCTIMTA